MKKYALILNPKAGRGKAERLQTQILNLLTENLGEVDLYRTEYSGHATEIGSRIKNEYSVIIVAGGDGTMHETVNGIIDGKATLAAIPIGSGNDFVKMLNLPKNIEEIIQVIIRDKRKRIDIGKIGDRYFPNGLGIGFDACVVRESEKVKRLRGFLIYLFSVIKTIFKYSNEAVTIIIDNSPVEKEVFLIAVGNGKAMGGGFYLTPDAIIDDGLFDICIINALSKREALMNLPKAIKGKHIEMEQVQMIRTDKLKIVSKKGIAAHADGELVGLDLKNIEISILPKALEVIYN
jgi:diacylglycerol kinase (ATP)